MYKIKLSTYAKVFYTEWLLSQGSTRYNMSMDQTLYGDINVERLCQACKRYVRDNLLLNSHIQDINGEPCWVPNTGPVEVEYSEDLVSKSDLLKYVGKRFDLEKGPLYRFKLLRIAPNVYRFIVVMHHILVDGSSLDDGLFGNLSKYYNDDSYVGEHSLDEQKDLISDLELSLSSRLQQHRGKHREFWHNHLSSAEGVDFSFLKLESSDKIYYLEQGKNPIATLRFGFGSEEIAKLNQIKKKYVITPYIFGQCIFAILLHRLTGQEHAVINYPVSVKEGAGFVYGAQLNANIIAYRFEPTTTIVDLLKQARDFFKSLKQGNVNHSYYPVAEAIQENKGSNLLNACFVQTNLRDVTYDFEGVNKVDVSYDVCLDSISQDMLLFEQEVKGGEINYQVRFDERVYNRELVEKFIKYYQKLFLDVLGNLSNDVLEKPISNYDLLNHKQYQELACNFNQTEADYPKDATIHELFERMVEKGPENVAVVYDAVKLSYRELNQKANQLANYLRYSYSIRPDDLIILCLDKSEYVPLTMLATLKSGGAYVPIDPKYPDERISYIIGDTKAKAILTNREHQERLQKIVESVGGGIDVLAIDDSKTQELLAKQKGANPVTIASSNNLIYVIYTSGTTGKPKGVLLEHRGVVNFMTYLIKYAHLSSNSVGANYAAFGFDAAVTEIYSILLAGGALHIIKESDRNDPEKINDYFNKNKVTFAFLPTKFAEFFYKMRNNRLQYLIVAGDKLDKFVKQSYLVINAYGPTEASVHTTSFVVEKPYRNIPIGKPINNVKCYVVDQNTSLQPVGVVGELLIGGECLARGYLNLPDLTSEKFISNPFQTEKEKLQNKNERLYRTGDLVRILPDGNLEYVGRNDFQVKIRGFRIELGEIENKLRDFPGIKHAVVLAKGGKDKAAADKYLVGYYVADEELDEVVLREYLLNQLPEYMVPKGLVYLKELPLSLNGKLDVKILPDPSFTDNNYIEPRNELEQIVCNDFSRVLGIDKVGINDDFFSLGGDSLKAISLTSVLQNNFDIKVANIFEMRTPRRIAEKVPFAKNSLKTKLEKIKLLYKDKQSSFTNLDPFLQDKVTNYSKEAAEWKINADFKKDISTVVLTGSTGYLGCNILNQLLLNTSYNIILLVRGHSQEEAYARINNKFKFYFDRSLDDLVTERVLVLKSDIERDKLGLTHDEYEDLVANTSSIIHAAALVKHHGEYNKFFSANVQATINLLNLSARTNTKDFHFVSSYSVLTFGFIPDYKEYIYTEDDMPDNLEQFYNVYNQTKLMGERETLKFRDQGVTSNIYRVGNLAYMAENYRAQENLEDNAFYSWLKCICSIGCVGEDISVVEISQADLTAQAMVKLFDKVQASNYIYHLFNHNHFDISGDFSDCSGAQVKGLAMDGFIDNIVNYLDRGLHHEMIVRFLLRQGWLDGLGLKGVTSIKVLQDRTKNVLRQLGFEWPVVTKEIFCEYLKTTGLYKVK